ncbi:helix-turn-helix transcriptional regulator [Anaeromyxobacter diazotrophicus]|uniref:Transcriptional regulator n=1 Tax=Anaeromyxobacter diazotrophicus TaxID=2590199 RepID=A0A7I9VH32_9BACT|nr:WYL domain-containing protein [Anaeromyxobacter diazotrophicus]GEJ55702.1 transcriptional regulator [Anaeromyxobacter diazotrophicus]
MQKAERLLDLAAFLLRAAEPVSWREIQEQFPGDYGGSEEAAIRKFERDKAELLELGIPVRWDAQDEDRPAGYLIDRDEFYLPNLELPPEDLVLLYLAGSAALAQGAFPYAKDLAHALNKLSFAARAPGASETAALAARHLSSDDAAPARPGGGGPLAQQLEELSAAVMAKKRVHLAYQGAERRARTERDVDPYGLYQSGSAWFLVGWCHLRRDVRTFHLARILELSVNAAAPRTPDFAVPAGFDLHALATRETWEYAIHAPERCTVRLEGPVSPEARASFGPRAQLREEDGAVVVELVATNAEALLRHVLALERAQVVAPARLRQQARAVLDRLAERLA